MQGAKSGGEGERHRSCRISLTCCCTASASLSTPLSTSCSPIPFPDCPPCHGMHRMLTVDPTRRITLEQVWQHPWVRAGPRWEPVGSSIYNVKVDVHTGAVYADAQLLQELEEAGFSRSKMLQVCERCGRGGGVRRQVWGRGVGLESGVGGGRGGGVRG